MAAPWFSPLSLLDDGRRRRCVCVAWVPRSCVTKPIPTFPPGKSHLCDKSFFTLEWLHHHHSAFSLYSSADFLFLSRSLRKNKIKPTKKKRKIQESLDIPPRLEILDMPRNGCYNRRSSSSSIFSRVLNSHDNWNFVSLDERGL